MTVVTRFAPSPTGYFHAGSYRTALFAWIFARQNAGKFILRIEDTDKERSKKEYEENIIESLEWLGLKYDEFYRQSDRIEIYKKHIESLIASGHAYISTAEQENERARIVADKTGEAKTKISDGSAGRSSVIRFKNPNKKVVFDDIIRGRIEFDTTELGDFVIAKNENEPVFHLVVVIDDHEMGITHVIRGEDHISNTPRQILIYEALGAPIPQYAHIPLLLASDRSKLSKRHGAIPVSEYRSRGYLREALINYLALLGWHPEDDTEILSISDIISKFSLDRVQKSGAIFDEEKLAWFNRQYIIAQSDEEFARSATTFMPEWISPKGDLSSRLMRVLKSKITTFGDIPTLLNTGGELAFINNISDYDRSALLWKKNPDITIAHTHLTKIRGLLVDLPADFDADKFKAAIWTYVETHGKGDVLWPLRMALTGQERSPDPFVCAALIGQDLSLKRIDIALAKLA